MQWSLGFKRLWLVLTMMICLLAGWQALGHQDLSGTGEGSSSCIPGTELVRNEEVQVGSRHPSPAEVREAIRTKPEYFSEQPDGTYVQLLDPFAIMETRTYFRCTTYIAVVRDMFVGALVSLLIGLTVALISWAITGFRDPI